MEHPKAKGDRTTLAVLLALQSLGCTLLLPFGENARYDLVIDHDGRFERVQCKTGRLRNGAIVFATTSTYGHHRNPTTARKPYTGQIDSFGVYCPDNGGVYLVPIGDLPNRASAALRVETARNNQVDGIRPASHYEVAWIPVTLAAAT